MAGIFISYRREDAAGHAGRLFDRLNEHFGKDLVFMDVTGIEPGVDFVTEIENAVGACKVLLAVIGRDWATCTGHDGQRRLNGPNDFIRLEVSSALKRDVRVIPILVEGAMMPSQEMLPADLKRLARRNALELRDTRWNADVQDLVSKLERIMGPPKTSLKHASKTPQPPPSQTSRTKPAILDQDPKLRFKGSLWGVVGFAVLVIVGVSLYFLYQPQRIEQIQPEGSSTTGGQPTSYTDFDVFVCSEATQNDVMQDQKASVVEVLEKMERTGEIGMKTWNLYNEVSLEQLRDKLTIIVDKEHAEKNELPRLELAFQEIGKQMEIQILENTSTPSPWRISIIICPSQAESALPLPPPPSGGIKSL